MITLAHFRWFGFSLVVLTVLSAARAGEPGPRVYENRLTPLVDPKPLLADHPEFVEPVRERARFEAPLLVDDEDADLHVRAWRFSYNARGIIEMPNRLRAAETALIMVHPWGIDDGQGWKTPEPNGVCDFCTPAKNAPGRPPHARGRQPVPQVAPRQGRPSSCTACPGPATRSARSSTARSATSRPTQERRQGEQELKEKLASLTYKGEPLPAKLTLSAGKPVADYFRQFPGLDAGPRYNGPGFWKVPIPVTKDIDVDPDDVVIFDDEGYPALARLPEEEQDPPRPLDRLRDRHVLLPDDGRLREPLEGLQRVPGRRRHPGDVPEQRLAAVRHQRLAVVRRARPIDHADFLGPLHRDTPKAAAR